MGGTYRGQSAARTGCDHGPPPSTLQGGSAVQGQGGGAPMWSVAVHCACGDWGFPGGAGQGQSPPVFAWGPLSELHSNLRWLLLVLGLEIPRGRQTVNLVWLLLLLGLGLTKPAVPV